MASFQNSALRSQIVVLFFVVAGSRNIGGCFFDPRLACCGEVARRRLGVHSDNRYNRGPGGAFAGLARILFFRVHVVLPYTPDAPHSASHDNAKKVYMWPCVWLDVYD